MANTFSNSKFRLDVSTDVTGDSGAKLSSRLVTAVDYKNSVGAYYVTNVLTLSDYSLTVASGGLALDLFDLGTLDLGAGAGRDNLGGTWATTKVHSVMVKNSTASDTGILNIDQAAATTTAWSKFVGADAVISLEAGSFISASFGVNGVSVTDVTDHILQLAATVADCVIDVHVTVSQP